MLNNDFLPGTLAAAVARRHGRGAGRHPVVIVEAVAVWTAGNIVRYIQIIRYLIEIDIFHLEGPFCGSCWCSPPTGDPGMSSDTATVGAALANMAIGRAERMARILMGWQVW